MPLELGIEIDKADLRALELDLLRVRGSAAKVLADASNHMTKKSIGHKIISDEVRTELNLKAGAVKSPIRSGKRASQVSPSSSLKIVEKNLPNATDFVGTRQTNKGVSVRFRKGKPKEVITGSFLARVKSGKRLALTRYKTYSPRELFRGPRGGKTRAITGPTITGILTNNPEVARRTNEKLSAEFWRYAWDKVGRLLGR